MMEELKRALQKAANDATTKALILTGTDPYYSAGVNLAGTLRLGHPQTLHETIVTLNQALFQAFIDFPKPILAAINGPAIGAATTSTMLCDAIIVSERSSISTPFAKLGVAREGCSTYLFPKVLGESTAERILGKEGWSPSGKEILDIGFAQWCVSHDQLLEEAQRIAEDWVTTQKPRSFKANAEAELLREINRQESIRVATSFFGSQFLDSQFEFLWTRKKRMPAMFFRLLRITRPIWFKLLKSSSLGQENRP